MKAFVVPEPRVATLRALNYAPAIERIRRGRSRSSQTLREIVKAFGPAYGTVFTRKDCDVEYGIELLSQTDMFAAEPRGRVIRRDSMPEPHKHLIRRGDVLIAGAGTLGESELFGRAVIADGRLADKYVGPDSMTLIFASPDDDYSLFAYAWLASPTGVQAIRATSYGTKLLRFRTELLETMPIPEAPAAMVARIATLVRRCSSEREAWLAEVQTARALMNAHPGLASTPSHGRTAVRAIVWSGGLPSLCAWNYLAGTPDVLRALKRAWKARVSDYLDSSGPVHHGGRLTRIPCLPPHGVDFLSQRDVFMARQVPQRIAVPKNADWVFAKTGQLLMAADGQVTSGSLFGRIELADGGFVGAAITEHIMRLNPARGCGDALAAWLSTDVGQALTRSTATGTSVPKARVDLLLDLPAPEPSSRIVGQAAAAMRRSVAHRVAANEAEAEAIRLVEEEVLPRWLA